MTGRIFEDSHAVDSSLRSAVRKAPAAQDAYEERLMLEVEQRRAELTARAEAFGRTVKSTFDPRERVRRNPATSLLASVATGLAFGFLPSLRRTEKIQPARADSGRISPLSLAGDVLKSFGPPFLSSILSGFLRR